MAIADIGANSVSLVNKGSAPSGTEGDVYYNSTSKKLQIHNGTGFVDVGGSGGASMTGATKTENYTLLAADVDGYHDFSVSGTGQGFYPLLQYKLNADSSDSSGNLYNGTDTSVSYVAGKISNAGSYNGTSSKTVIPTVLPVKTYGTTGYSIAFWIKPASVTNDGFIYAETSSGANFPYFAFWIDSASSGKIRMYMKNDANTVILDMLSTHAALVVGTWYHVVWTDSNGQGKLYIDGTQDASSFVYTPGSVANMSNAAIGCLNRASPTLFYSGLVDDFRIYQKALTAGEVTVLYNSGTGTETTALSDGVSTNQMFFNLPNPIGTFAYKAILLNPVSTLTVGIATPVSGTISSSGLPYTHMSGGKGLSTELYAPGDGNWYIFHNRQEIQRVFGFVVGGGATTDINTLNMTTPSVNALSTGTYMANVTQTTSSIRGNTFGFCMGGNDGASGYYNTIGCFAVTTRTQNAVSVGTKSLTAGGSGGLFGRTLGIAAGGSNASSTFNTIEYINLNSVVQNASSVGTLIQTRFAMASMSSDVYGVIAGGSIIIGGSNVATMEYINLMTTSGNASSRGVLPAALKALSGAAGYTYGFILGGYTPAQNTISWIDFTTLISNASAKGTLSVTRAFAAGFQSHTLGFVAGGYNGSVLASIDYVDTTTTIGNGVAAGVLTATKETPGGV